ncbi:Uncharacterised protein [Leminorella richardii]|uniref:Uncharacterized protein n=1 Tax=Leminorella richardii TaxID=158841 RepID=A0A2X4V446_9GAMM|nr:hypothetical protein [Leminorella richardii]SQI40070.1 Uncharacterised protein [Leminorella richardii]
MEEQSKKQKKPLFDDVHGLRFMESWPAILRWLSILPVAIVVFLIVRILFVGTVLNIMQQSMPLVANYVGAVATLIVYCPVVEVSAAAAPSKRTAVATVLALGISGSLIYTAFAFWHTLSFEPNVHTGIVLTLSTVCATLGSFLGVRNTYVRSKKQLLEKVQD